MKPFYHPIGLIVIISNVFISSAHAHPGGHIVHSHIHWNGPIVIAAAVFALVALNTMISAKREKT